MIFTLRCICNNFDLLDHDSTIRFFEDTYAKVPRWALNPWKNNYAFHIDETETHTRLNDSGYGASEEWREGSRPMTKEYNGPTRLKYIVEVQGGLSTDEHKTMLKKIPNEGTGKLATEVYEENECILGTMLG